MDKYQKAMFRAYWFPVTLFYLFPNAVFLYVAWPLDVIDAIKYSLPFPAALFLSGFLLAPFFGPKVKANKFWAFLMAFICTFIAVCMYLAGMSAFNFGHIEYGLMLIVILAALGIFPALLGSLLFIGACERVSAMT